jgi:hypothetical protein
MKNKTSALLFVLASSALILAGCGGKTAASSTSADASSTATSKSTPTSTPASSTNPASSTTLASSEPTVEKVNVMYVDGAFGFGTESEILPGQMVYWAGNGGTVTSHTYAEGKYTLAYSSTGDWYGVQVFYKLPYAVAGDTYDVAMTVNSDVAGDITIGGTVHSLVAGANALHFGVTQGAGATIGIQLGTVAGSKLGGAAFSFTAPVINDTTAGASYHEVKFVNDTATLKDIQVKAGKLVTAPVDPTPATGYVFLGWFNGTTEFNASSAVTAATTYTAKFIAEADAVRYTVTFMNGATSLGTVQVIKGRKITLPNLDYGFGKTAWKWYKEAALTNEWALDSDVVTADITLYVKLRVATPANWINAADAGFKLPDSAITIGDNGEAIVKFNGWGADPYYVQINFNGIPVGITNTNYRISFTYKVNAEGGDAQIYDTASKGTVTLPTATSWNTLSMDFAGGVLAASNKLTFELGHIALNTAVDFELSDVTLSTIA